MPEAAAPRCLSSACLAANTVETWGKLDAGIQLVSLCPCSEGLARAIVPRPLDACPGAPANAPAKPSCRDTSAP